MIYEVEIQDPAEWIEKTTRKEKDETVKSSLHPLLEDEFSEDLSRPNLRGRTFKFKPGLNVVVGPNGSGKSSLFNLLCGVFSCGEGDMASAFSRGGLSRIYSKGVFTCCRVSANYNVSSFRFQRPDDAGGAAERESVASGINRVKTSYKSKGQKTMMTLESLLALQRNDGVIGDGIGEEGISDFRKNIVEAARKINTPSMEAIVSYYEKNHRGDLKAVTFLMDGVDDHLDVPNQKLLFNLFLQVIANQDKYQFIVSLNSLLLIQSLAPISGINWIDLDGNYLNAILNIGSFAVGGKGNKDQAKEKDGDEDASSAKE